MSTGSTLHHLQTLVRDMLTAARAGEFERVVQLEIQQKDLLAGWFRQNAGSALQQHDADILRAIRADIDAICAECERARDRTAAEGRSLASHRDAAQTYIKSSGLKG